MAGVFTDIEKIYGNCICTSGKIYAQREIRDPVTFEAAANNMAVSITIVLGSKINLAEISEKS